MRIEKWKLNGKIVNVPILEENEKETNEVIDDLEKTLELTENLKDLENTDAN